MIATRNIHGRDATCARNERLLAHWPKVESFPHLFVLDARGRVLRSQAGAALEGGRNYDKAKVLRFLQESRAPEPA
jgi:hypothetical protein